MTIAAHRSTGDKDVATHLHSYTNLAALPHTPPLVIVEGDGIQQRWTRLKDSTQS